MKHPSDTSGHTIRCPKCDFENREGRRFCSNCGAALSSVCPACGFVNEPEEKFCGGCGVALAAAETSAAPSAPGEDTAAAPSDPERRQVTILFSDLSGFTALSQSREPEEVQRIVSRHFEVVDGIVTDFGGTIDKHIGDAVMALFGAPVAHGNDPERAVRAALAIQDAMASRGPDVDEPLEVHIGIASGQVVASRVGSDIHREYTVTGESVNLAARLVELAASGETLISDAVHRAIDGLVDVEEVRDVSIKGVDRPIKVWRLQGLRDARAPGHDRPLVGRRAELAQFRGVLESCRETGLGQAIYVRGEAGIGKTRLVEEFA
ncbi:MAG: adenylate/guanylate cyclase domain-containing protein, partial [Alphaproteobacteria bacterium]